MVVSDFYKVVTTFSMAATGHFLVILRISGVVTGIFRTVFEL